MILYTLLSGVGGRVVPAAIGVLVIFTGLYFLLRNAFGLVVPPINWDLVWPVIVMLSGAAILRRAMPARSNTGTQASDADQESPAA